MITEEHRKDNILCLAIREVLVIKTVLSNMLQIILIKIHRTSQTSLMNKDYNIIKKLAYMNDLIIQSIQF